MKDAIQKDREAWMGVRGALHQALALRGSDLPAGFRVLASTERCRVQAIASEERGWWGTQFHPESYRSATPAGERILRTFFELAAGSRS